MLGANLGLLSYGDVSVMLLKLYDEYRYVHVMLSNRRNGRKHTSVKYKSVLCLTV